MYYHIHTSSQISSDNGYVLITDDAYVLALAPVGATLAFVVLVGRTLHVGRAEGLVPRPGQAPGLLVLHTDGVLRHRLSDFVGYDGDDEDEIELNDRLKAPDLTEWFPASSVAVER
ncbi:MAG TPA: hypothetical protein VF576_02720 [Rubricoccaceae bacterium]